MNKIEQNIFPCYQEIKDISKNKIIKYEALVRSYENEKLVFPNDILKHVDPKIITKKMFEIIKQDIKKYKFSVSFNIALTDIQNDEIYKMLLDGIQEKIDTQNTIANYLTFEFIEEENIINDKQLVKDFIKEIHRHNAKVALDDFGKGYATFEPLLEFDFDIIKFDSVLVKNFLENPTKYYLLDTLLEMFKRLEKDVIAEFIETEEEYNALKYIECNYAQGYYIGKPKKIQRIIKNNT